MMRTKQMFVFGPVPSRRLGRSLGIDLVPYKTCSFDCIYCQLGRTTNLTTSRKRYVPIKKLLQQLVKKLDEGVVADYITVSGSGEPTLNSGVGELIESVKKRVNIPVAVLTNGSLLWSKDVQKELLQADVVLPSLDAGAPETFRAINRPHVGLGFEKIVEGIVEFRRIYKGRMWLEVFLVDALNSGPSHIKNIKRCVDLIQPDKVQLNTVVRPAAEDFAKPVSPEGMMSAKEMLGDIAEVIADYETSDSAQTISIMADDIMALLRRRPCTLEDMMSGLRANRNEMVKRLTLLEVNGSVQRITLVDRTYYQIVEQRKGKRHRGQGLPRKAKGEAAKWRKENQ